MGWLRCCELVQLESRAREHAAGRPQGEWEVVMVETFGLYPKDGEIIVPWEVRHISILKRSLWRQ